MTAIATPCIQVCTLDFQTDLCLGCGRSRAEIGAWSALTDAERAAIMAALADRLARLHARLAEEAREAGPR